LTQQRYSFDIRSGTGNADEPVTSIDKTIIAFDLEAVIKYCESEYDMTGLDEIVSDELNIVFEKSYIGQVSDHGNINEVSDTEDILDNEGQVKEEYQGEYGDFRDVVDISGGEITQKDYEYMISGQYHNTVIDLTEESN
jgi:hypothetical protein